MYSMIQVSQPAIEPVGLDELKLHLRLSSDDEDDLLTGLIKAARKWCEVYTRRSFVAQSLCLFISGTTLPREIALPRGPVLSVQEVTTYGAGDQATVADASIYYVDLASVPGRVCLREGASWPSDIRSVNGLSVSYSAGYGAIASDVPDDIKLAIKQAATHWYENRGEESAPDVPASVRALLTIYRVAGLGAA